MEGAVWRFQKHWNIEKKYGDYQNNDADTDCLKYGLNGRLFCDTLEQQKADAASDDESHRQRRNPNRLDAPV